MRGKKVEDYTGNWGVEKYLNAFLDDSPPRHAVRFLSPPPPVALLEGKILRVPKSYGLALAVDVFCSGTTGRRELTAATRDIPLTQSYIPGST